MLSKGIYYPDHQEDTNGISSGNFLSVFEPFEGSYKFSEQRLRATIASAKAQNCHTLLLSSEFFFNRLLPVFDLIPNARCIAYVRNPAQLHESHYNQSVKRHGNTAVIGRAEALPMHTLKVLGDYAKKLQNKLTLCAYHDVLFVNNNIVSDFLDAIGVSYELNANLTEVSRINSSYTLEALEIKRWFNSYNLGRFANPLDRVLQSYTDGINNFTFVGKHQFNDYKRQSIKWLERLSEQAPFAKSDALIEAIRNQEHQAFYKQEITETQCEKVLLFIAEKDPVLLKNIALCVYGQTNIKNKTPFIDVLFSIVPPKQALPNILDYLRGAFFGHHKIKFNDCIIANKNMEHALFREHVKCLLQVRFSLVAYIKALLASY